MSWAETISLLIALLALCGSFYAIWVTNNYQKYDYSARLEVEDEIVTLNLAEPSNNAFKYESRIINKGSRTIKIQRVMLHYGSREDSKKRIKYVIEGSRHLAPCESMPVSIELEKSRIEEMQKKFDIKECFLFLVIQFYDVNGKTQTISRALTGVTEEGVTVYIVQAGQGLT